MIKRKLKMCGGECGKMKLLWAGGMCKPCYYSNGTKAKRYSVSPVSEKRRLEQSRYTVLRRKFLLLNPYCACGGLILGCDGVATTVHHTKGRIGKLFLDVRYWKALTLSCHQWVELHPIEAKEMKLSLNRL